MHVNASVSELSFSNQDMQIMSLEIDFPWHVYALLRVKPDYARARAPQPPAGVWARNKNIGESRS